MQLSFGHYFILLALTFSTVLNANVYDGPIDDQTYIQLQSQVQQKQTELEAKIDQALALDLAVEYAQVSLVTIKLFTEVFAPWDRANPVEVQNAYAAKGFSRFDPVGPDGLAFDELSDSIVVANNAIAQLQHQIDQTIELKRPPDFSQHKLVLNGPNYELNGAKVIAAKFFWQPEDSELMTAYGTGGESYYSVQDLETETAIRQNRKSSFLARVNRQVSLVRAPIQFFLGHIIPQNSWFRSSYPLAFSSGSRLFTDYDIDNPNVRPWLTTLFEQQLADGVSLVGELERVHMLANEPTFSIRQGGVNSGRGVSDFTRAKYVDWVSNKYTNIDALNTLYGTSFTSFQQLDDTYTIPLDVSYQGGPIWYDWMRFNMDRVNDWFTFLHNGVHAVDTDAKTHIKVMGERSIHTAYYDEGLDFEYIAKLADMPGSDNQSTPFAAHWDVRFEQQWRQRYSFEWRSQAIMLDFNKSLAPNKLFYDSEWHGLSGSRWRDFHMSPEYVRSVLWTGAVDGLGGLTSWVWNRKEDGSIDPRADFVGTSVTQPIQLDAYGRALKELNAHGNHVAALVPKDRYLMIYFNNDAAIQDPEYTSKMTDIYEALKLLNIPVGFVTPSDLQAINRSQQTVIVAPSAFISDQNYLGLQNFIAASGNVVVIDESASLIKDESGKLRDRTKLNAFFTMPFSDVISMFTEFKQQLATVLPSLPITVAMTNPSDASNFGVLSQQYYDQNLDAHIVSLINTRQSVLTLTLSNDSAQIAKSVNLLNANEIESQFSMQPMEVVLLSVELAPQPQEVLLSAINLSPANMAINSGQSTQINASLVPDNATNPELIWGSSNESIATVTSAGRVSGVAAGTVTISANNISANINGSISVTVSAPAATNPQPPANNAGASGGGLSTILLLLLFLRLSIRKRHV